MTQENPSQIIPLKSTHVTWKVLEGEAVLLNLDTGVYFTLNVTGTAAWALIDGRNSLAEITRALCGQFDVPMAQAQRDVGELTQALQDEGLVRITHDTSSAARTQRA
jgi:hypothetical protein